MEEKHETLTFWQDFLFDFDVENCSPKELEKLASGRFLLFETIVQKQSPEKIFEALELYKNISDLLNSKKEIQKILKNLSSEILDDFLSLETELFNLENVEEMLYLPGGYAGLFLAVNMRNKPDEYLMERVDEALLEQLIDFDVQRGTPASHFFVVAALNHHLDLLKSPIWDKCKFVLYKNYKKKIVCSLKKNFEILYIL